MSAHIYRGTIQAVILDWGGTVLDHGCRDAVAAMRQTMGEAGVEPTEGDLRRNMGLSKLEQIRGIFENERVREAWVVQHGVAIGEAALLALLNRYTAIELQTTQRDLLPGVMPLHEFLRQLGVVIATTTSQERPVLHQMLEMAGRQGHHLLRCNRARSLEPRHHRTRPGRHLADPAASARSVDRHP